MIRPLAIALLVPLAACTPRTEVHWSEGFAFDWDLFNHRLSAMSFALAPDSALFAAV